MRALRIAGKVAAAVLIALASAWCVLAILRAPVGSALVREELAAVFGLAALAALVGLFARRWRARGLAAFAIVVVAFAIGWSRIEPSNDRPWRAEEALLPYADIDGDRITVHNIRNFSYRTETDFTPAYYDKTFDLSKLDSVDLGAVYWMGPDIAHILLSFGFAGQDYLAISIEARKEQGEGYSTLDGFFRHYELFYVVADERDVIGVRASHRGERPSLYRIDMLPENAKKLLLRYLDEVDDLAAKPRWYNALTHTCTTEIRWNLQAIGLKNPLDWRIFANAHLPELMYERKTIDTSLPLAELVRISDVTEKAKQADGAPDFSKRIREGLPGMGS